MSTPPLLNFEPVASERDAEIRALLLSRSPARHAYFWVRAIVDSGLATVLLLLFSPILFLLALLVRMTSKGPIFYSQTRLTRDGRPFTIYKYRSMRDNCERKTGPQWASRRDSRVTWLGRFLRPTHLDELPQLWNVSRGDMSLVGPRPERPEFVSQLELKVPCYRLRLLATQGITGLAQVYLLPDMTTADVQKKLVYDLYYIRHQSAWLDLRLLACTAVSLLGIPFAWSRRWFGLPQPAAIDAHYREFMRQVEELFLRRRAQEIEPVAQDRRSNNVGAGFLGDFTSRTCPNTC